MFGKISSQKRAKQVVVIGGGTGTYTILSGLKKYPPDMLELTAVVTVADSGGSTGRLRDEFGYLPVGDVRMALLGMAEDEINPALRELFLYRFNKGEGLSGHNFGNLFLIALTDIFGSEEKAIEYASRILRVRGKVLPVTNTDVALVAEYENGEVIEGETHIDEPGEHHDGKKRIKRLSINPSANITDNVKNKIAHADLIVLGPGDLYTSVLANIVVGGMAEAVQNTHAKLCYVVNLMTKYGQTYGFTAQEHVDELEKYIGRRPDIVLMNSEPLPDDILAVYEKEHDFPVRDDLRGDIQVIRKNFLVPQEVKRASGDVLKRSLIRHDGSKLAEAIMSIF